MPNRPRTRVLVPLLCLAAVAGVSVLSVWKSPPFPLSDSAFFEYYGWNMLHGQRLYVDLLDVKLPSVFYVNELWQWLFGENYSLHTWAEAGVNLVSIGLFTCVLRQYRVALWAPGAVIFAVFFCLPFPEFNYAQHYAVPLILLAFCFAGRRWDVAAGVAIALATTFWVPAILMLVPVLYVDRSRKRALWMGLGTVGGLLAYYAFLVPFLGANWPSRPIALWPSNVANTGLDLGQIQQTIFHSELGPAIGALVAALLTVVRRPRTQAQKFALCWSVCAVVGAAIPPRFSEHFFLPSVPALSMAICTYEWRIRLDVRRLVPLVVTAALVVVTCAQTYWFTVGGWRYATYVRMMGDGIRAYTGPGEVVWTDEYVPELYLALRARQPDTYGSIHGAGSGYLLLHRTIVRVALEPWRLPPSVVVFGPNRDVPRDLSIIMAAPGSDDLQVYDIICPDITFGSFKVYAVPALADAIRCHRGPIY